MSDDVQHNEPPEGEAGTTGAPEPETPDTSAEAATGDASPPTDDPQALRREAAGHRRKARDAEQERDQLAERVTAFQRAEVERLASTRADGYQPFADAADLWRGDGVDLADLLDADGNVIPDKVREVASGVLSEHPHWKKTVTSRPAGDADAGKGAAPRPPSATDEFSNRLRSLGGRAA